MASRPSASRPSARSVKISADERTGWSSDRPRRDGAPERPAGHLRRTVACSRRRIACATRPGACLIVVSASPAERDSFVDTPDRGSRLPAVAREGSHAAGRAGRPKRSCGARAGAAAGGGRQSAWRTGRRWCSSADGLAGGRARLVRAHGGSLKRPRHLILLETTRDQVPDEDLAALNALRRALDAGELGGAGLSDRASSRGRRRLGGQADLFRPPPREE